MKSKITDILQELIKEKIIEVETRTWYDDVLTETIIKYNEEVPKDKEKITEMVALRDKLRQQIMFRLELSDKFE